MATNTNDSYLHLSRPLGPSTVSNPPSTAALSISLHPQALFSILDHSQRRPPSAPRVIGTLLGTRSEDGTLVSITTSFAVGHTENAEQVEVDMDYQKQMLALHLRANPKEVLVGWYATSSELNTFSALIQNFYGGQGEGTWPYPAVHLTVSTEPGKEVEVRTYISSPVGVTAERAADSAAFLPVPFEIQYGDDEKSGLESIAGTMALGQERTGKISTDIETLEKSVEEVLDMLGRVETYVEGVLDEEVIPSTALGQYLLNTLALAPKVDITDIERNLYVTSPISSAALLTNFCTVTTTFKMFLSFPTLPTQSAHRWISQTD